MRKKVLALVLALVMVIAMLPTVAFATDFADTKGHWAEAQIDRWTDAGVVGGDGTGFNPNGNMTRAEAAKTFASLLKLSKKADLTSYTDVPTAEWKVDALAMAVAKGIINGMSATTLVPDGTLTREQMFVMIGRALGIEPATTSTKTFADGTQTSSWATGYINALANMGVINGVGENRLNPTANINRASVMTALDNLIGGYANTDGQTVEIVPGKITLVVADDVKVTGTADPERPIVIAGAAKTVDLEGVTVTGDAAPVVQVQVEEVAIENAPEGTTVAAPAEATDVTVNGETVAAGSTTTAPAPEPETSPSPSTSPSSTPVLPPVVEEPTPSPSTDPSTEPSTQPSPETKTYTVTFYATWGSISKTTGSNGTTFEDTCYGGENKDGKFPSVKASVKEGDTLVNLIPNLTPRESSTNQKWELIGWNTKPGVEGMTGENKDTPEYTIETVKNITVTSDMSLYAVWKDPQGATCYGGENADVGDTGDTEPENITVTCYSTQGTFTLPADGSNPNTCDGGHNSAGNVVKVTVTLKKGTTLRDANLLKPTWDEWIFKGWATQIGSATYITEEEEASKVLTDGMSLYAVWQNGGQTCYGDENTIQGITGTGTTPGSGR